MAWLVYKHTSPSGKVYIGITSKSPEARWQKGGTGYRNCPYFWRAIRKYGWENIEHEILLDGLTEEEACQKEVELIAEYKSTDPQYGYNDLVGGTSGKHGRPYSEETLQKMSEACKRNWQDPEYRKHMSEVHKGYVIPEETKRKMSEAHKGKNTWSKGRKASPETLKKLSEASKARGAKPPSWKGKHHSEETKRKIGEAHRGFNPFAEKPMTPEHFRAFRTAGVEASRSPVRQLKDGVVIAEFKSMKEAAEAIGQSNTGNISNCCKGKLKSAYGYQWQYIPKGEIANG